MKPGRCGKNIRECWRRIRGLTISWISARPSGFRRASGQRKRSLTRLRGTILIWDPIYGVFNSDARRSIPEEEIEAAGWVRDEESSYLINDEDAEDKDRWSIWLSPQTQSGMATGDILQMTALKRVRFADRFESSVVPAVPCSLSPL